MACPLNCAWDELHCQIQNCTGPACVSTDTCVKRTAGCPVTCSADQKSCHRPATSPGSGAGNTCEPKNMACPLYCASDERLCQIQPPHGCTGPACAPTDACVKKT